MKALLLHGFMSDKDSFFLPNTKEYLESLGFEVFLDSYPNPNNPSFTEWVQTFKNINQSEFDLVIAHSLGGTFALNLITQGIMTTQKLVMLGSSMGPKKNSDMNSFLIPALNLVKIMEQTPEIFVLQSYDDPWTLPVYGQVSIQSLNAVGLYYADQGHFEREHLPKHIWQLLDLQSNAQNEF